MDEFGVLTERFGLKPQGKSAPMARAKRPPNVADSQTRPNSKSPLNGSPSDQNSTFDFDYGVFSSSNSNTDNKTQRFDDIFGGDAKSNGASFDYDSIFSGSNKPVSTSSYVDDIFGGMHEKSFGVDDLLDKIGGLNTNAKSPNAKTPAFDDLIPGFGVSNNGVEMNKPSITPNKPAAAVSQDDPFLIFETASSSASSESFLDALEQISSKSNNSKGTKGVSPSLKSPPKPMSKVNRPSVSTTDELEDFATGGAQTNASSRKANVNAAETKQNLAARMNNGKRVPAAKVNQANGVDDLESFFSMGSRSSSVPKSRTPTMDHMYDNQMKNKEKPEVSPRVPSRSSASVNKSPVMTSLDDLSLMFGGSPSSEFQEVEGETEERRKARLVRHQRAQERALKAVNDMNQRDLQTKMEQEERRKIADTADVQIKRWAAGKEGNMRALLSTLQYVLWPECGWQPVSLTDMITSSAVKKVYRKANLYIHPDKVQQKGATLEQKYTAEKVFDILKEAYTKFNAEELS